jgi:2,4-dienoyl-CoA reductase-like NADH-dependent reductase (Old Yellow Enzyme family)
MKTLLMAEPIRIHRKTAANRIVYHPMECNDADEKGNPTDVTLKRYRRFAEGGPGVIFVEGCKVTKESHGRVRDLGAELHNIEGLGRIVSTIREVNPDILILFQISHDGRRSGAFSKVVSVYPTGDRSIHVLTTEELVAIEDMFAASAWVVEQAGGDGVDIKTCNGYLGSEVLRPANTRGDGYGGSFENRTRFFRETLEKVRKRVSPDFILGARISREVIPGGVGSEGEGSCEENLSEFVEFARLMQREGMHYVSVHVSNATYFAEKWVQMPTDKNPEDVFVHFRLTRMIKEAVNLPVMGAGYSYLGRGQNKLPGNEPDQKSFTYWAERNLREHSTDMVGVGRQSFADPHFARKILGGELDEITYCKTCQGCFMLVTHQEKSGCVVYDERYRKSYRNLQQRIRSGTAGTDR